MIVLDRLQMRWTIVFAALFCLQTARMEAQPLVWDAVSRDYTAKSGETLINFSFADTNVSPADILIRGVRTSCGCTVAKLPPLPWRIGPGTNDHLEVTVDIRGKRGTLSKVISVETSSGLSLLTVNVKIPEDRGMNMELAKADRQAVFKNDCASCHLYPTIGKTGEGLYLAACGICHESDHRATMVPDLKALAKSTNHDYWDTWVRKGKEGSLMPAFSKEHGGPLSDEQIHSLVSYLTKTSASLDLGNPFQTQ